MIHVVPSFLSPDVLAGIRESLRRVRWLDGRSTAGPLAASGKQNQQADLTTRDGAALARDLQQIILNHPDFDRIVIPSKLAPLRISRTTKDGGYQEHFDNALMASRTGVVRSDVSFTLFLVEPESYEGGDLIIHLEAEPQRVKLAAGQMVIYPSGALHQVETVTSGTRDVCVGWAQSFVPDTAARGVLSDLKRLTDCQRKGSDAERLAAKIRNDLLRRWART